MRIKTRSTARVDDSLTRNHLRTAWRNGHAAEVIAEFAQAGNADLIVMGTHGSSALVNVVPGSDATGVIARCKLRCCWLVR
ncbi:MAG: universal stress protein [Pseudomonadota bacterium]